MVLGLGCYLENWVLSSLEGRKGRGFLSVAPGETHSHFSRPWLRKGANP